MLVCVLALAAPAASEAVPPTLSVPSRVSLDALARTGLPVKIAPLERGVRLALRRHSGAAALARRSAVPHARRIAIAWRLPRELLSRLGPGRYVVEGRLGRHPRGGSRRVLRAHLRLIAPARDPIVAPASTPTGRGTDSQRSAALHSTSTQPFVDAGGRPVPIVGFNVMPVWSDHPGRTWEQGRYDQIAAGGFTAVRFVLHWDDFEPVPGVFSSTSLSTLDTAIARAKAAGLRVVLDCIHLWGAGGMEDVPAWARTGDSVTTVATNGGGFLQTLARRYRDEPAVVAYDLVNEPYRWPIDQNSVLRAYDQLIVQVRKVDPDKIVLIEPTYGDTSIAGALADFSNLKNRANVVYSLHDYFAGGDDDGYAADGRQKGNYAWDGLTGYPTRDPAALEAHLRVHVDKLLAAGIPLWIGEFGIGAGVVGHDRWIADKVALFKRYGLGRAWWEYRTSDPFSATLPDGAWQPWIGLLMG